MVDEEAIRTVVGWSRGDGGAMSFSPRFSTLRISPIARVCGGTVNTVNIGSRALACPPIYITLCERGDPLAQMEGAPDQGV
jgi:hypothetical protein